MMEMTAPRRRVRMYLPAGLSFGAGLTGLLFITTLVVLASLIAPHDPNAQDIANARVPPIWHGLLYGDAAATTQHLLGTDKLGRDFLTRLLFGGRVSLGVALVVVVISSCIGVSLGLIAGYVGGKADAVISFIVSVRLSLPAVLVMLIAAAVFGSSLTNLVLVLSFLLWDRFCIVTRALAKEQSSRGYIEAAWISGCSSIRLLFGEMLPNLVGPLTVVATIEMANAILLEAAMSFLGLGAQPPTPSWGLMLAEAKEDLFFHSWMITLPGLMIFALVLSFNLLGDALRDHFAVESRI